MHGGGLIQLLTIGSEDAPLVLNPEITFFKSVYRKHTNFSIEQIIKNIGTKNFDCFHQFKIDKVVDLISGLHFIIDIPYFDVLKTETLKIITKADTININEFSVMFSNIKTYLFFESTSKKYYLIPENFFNLSEIDDYTNNVDGYELDKTLLNSLEIINSQNYGVSVDILALKKSKLNQLLPVLRLNFGQWTEYWLKIINKKNNFNYFTRLISQLSLVEELRNKIDSIIFEKFNNYNIFYKYKKYLNFVDEIKNYYLKENIVYNLIYDSDYALNFAIKNNLDINTCKLETLKFNSLFFLFLLQTLYPDFTTNVKSFTFWKKYNLTTNNIVNNDIPITSYNYFLEWVNRFDYYKKTSYGNYEKLNIEIYDKFVKKYNECETNITLLFNTINIKQKEKFWCILYAIYLRFNNKDALTNPLDKICFDDFFITNNSNNQTLKFIENEISDIYENNYKNFLIDKNIDITQTKFDKYTYIQPVDMTLIYIYLCYKYLELVVNNNIFNDNHFLVLWRNKINIGYFFRTIDNLDNYSTDQGTPTEPNSLKNVFYSLHDYNEDTRKLTFYHNINLTRDINLDIIRDELIKTIYSESFYGTIDIKQNDYIVNQLDIYPYNARAGKEYNINNKLIEIYEELIFDIKDSQIIITDSQIIIKNWNRNIFDEIFIKYKGQFIKMIDFEIKDNIVSITNQNLILNGILQLEIKTIYTLKIPIINITNDKNINLTNTTINDTRIKLYDISNNIISTNNINNKQIFCDISCNKNYFYQLNIEYNNGFIERKNVDFSNNYFVSELDLKYHQINKINLDIIDINLKFIQDISNNIKDTLNFTITNISSYDLSEYDTFWLIATSLNNKKITKEIFIPVKLLNNVFYIYGNISAYINYSWSLYVIYNDNQIIPNLFSILHHELNYTTTTKIKYSINQYAYQLPMIFHVSSNNNVPLYIFYNIHMTENATIKIDNNIIKKICPINSSQFYRYSTVEITPIVIKNIPIMFEFTNLQKYQSKSDLIKLLLNKFDETFLNNTFFGDIIKLLEKSTNLYKDLIIDTIKMLKELGKSIETVIDTSKIINNLNLTKYNNRDFDKYSVLAPKYYNISQNSLDIGLGINTIKLSSDWYILTQIKDIYTPANKISTDLPDYLKNVSNTMLKQIDYIVYNEDFQNIFNKNQYQEKYNYKYILENVINNNIIKTENYTIQTLYDMSNNYSNFTEIYFDNILIDISSNNDVSGGNLFEINNEKILFTEKFRLDTDAYTVDKFNYLGSIVFKNGNFNFNNDISNIQYVLTDDLKIIDLSNVNMNNLKTYCNSYQITLSSSLSEFTPISTKYVYNVEIPEYTDAITTNKGILISGNYYNLFKNTNYILVGDKELILTQWAIIGDSSGGNMTTFISDKTIDINNIKILNGFKSNIKVSGTQNNKIDKKYNLIDCIQNGIDTYYSVETSIKVELYDCSKNQLLPPFNIVNNQISYNHDNKNFIIENFNNDYWFKLDNNIIQGSKLRTLDISGNYDLSLYPNKFLKLIDTNAIADISNGFLNLSNIQLPNYSYYYIDNYVYYIKVLSSSYSLTDYLIKNTTKKKVYLLDDSNFRKRHSQYISIIDNISSEKILPSTDISGIQIYSDSCKLISKYGYDYKNKQGSPVDNELDLYLNFSINNNKFIRPINFTSNTNIIKVNLTIGSIDYNNFLFYKKSDLSNNKINGTINISGLFSSDSNFKITQNNFTLTDCEGIQKYKLIDASNNYTYVWTLSLDDSIINYDNSLDLLKNISDPIIINTNDNLIVNLDQYTLENNNNNIVDLSNNNLYFMNYFENRTRKQIYYNTNIIDKYSLQKLEYNHNSSEIIYCKLEDLGIINETNINGNQLIVPNYTNCKYIILIDASSNYKYCNVLASDETINKLIVDDEIDNNIYNVYGFKRNLILTKNEIHIWKALTNYYYLSTQKNSLFADDIIMIHDNIFRVIGLNSFKNIYEIELIRQYNNIKLYCNGYYLLYSKNYEPNIPKYEPIVSFTYGDVSGFKFNIDSSENLIMNNNVGSFCIKEGNNILLYYKDGNLYNPFNYLLNNNDYIVYNSTLYKINFILNDIIYLTTSITNISLNNYYQFYSPFQPCFMENLIFDSSGVLTNYYQKNIDYYFEYENNFIKSTNKLMNTALYTRVLKLSKRQYYFENKKNSYINGTFNGSIVTITENLSGYDFFFEQPILVNNIIKFIKNINGTNFTVSNGFNVNENEENFPIATKVKIYFGKRNSQNIYSNYLLDKVNYLKPELNLGVYHYYDISSGKIVNYDTSSNYLPKLNCVIFEDNSFWINDDTKNFLNLNKSYHILLEKTVNQQYVSHLCQIEFPNKLKLFTTFENYNSNFYLNKIYPIKINVNNTFEYLDMVIYKQKLINKKPSNKIEIWKKFEINVNGLVETIQGGFQVQVNIGDLSNYINTYEIYIDKKTLCNIELIGSVYYLKTKYYPNEFEYLYTKEINYITELKKNKYSYIISENDIFKKKFGLESIKLPINLTYKSVINYYFYNFDNNLTYIKDMYNNVDISNNFSIGDLNLLIQSTYIDKYNNYRVITTNDEVLDKTIFYINNINTNIFDDTTIQNDIENVLEEIIFETDFYNTILFNKIKTWNTWSILTNPETEKNQYLINGPLTFNKTFSYNENGNYFTNNEILDLTKSLSSHIFTTVKYEKIIYYQKELYNHLNIFFKYSDFWQDPITYINNFAIDISSEIVFDGIHLKLNNEILDDIIINNQFDISYNFALSLNIHVSRDINLIKTEIFNFINNKRGNDLYGVKILDVLNELVKISNELNNFKLTLKNFYYETKNFSDLLLNVLKNELYGTLNNFNSNLDKLQTSLAVDDFSISGIDVKNNIIMYNKTNDIGKIIYEYPIDTYQIMNLINIPYDTNYSIDTITGLYPYKIILFDEKYKAYTVYKIDFLSGTNTLNEPITIENPIVYNNQINFHFNENFDINSNYVISSFKTYDVSSEFLGYLYKVDIPSINFKDFTSIKYKKSEFGTYDDYLILPTILESFTSYIQAETPVGVYEYSILNNKTIITLIKLNISIDILSTKYISYYNDNSNFHKIEKIDGNTITIDGIINEFINPKIVITIKSPDDYVFNKTKVYRLFLSEPLITYADYINFKNVPKNFLINNEIKVIDMKFITDSIVDILVESSLDETYKINNIVHYARIGEYPPIPIEKIDKENMYLYGFNDIVPFKDISSCFILYDISYNKFDNILGKIKNSQFIDDFIKDISKNTYNLSIDVIQDVDSIKFITNKFLTDDDIHNHVFGGVINSYDISNYTYDSLKKILTFEIPKNLVIDSDYYYIVNNIYIDISNISINQNTLIITWIHDSLSGKINFKQVIIEKDIIKPKINQIYNIELFDNFDLNVNGYLQAINNSGNEIGQFVYKIINTTINDILNTNEVLINNSNMLKGTILYSNPLCIVTNELIKNIYTLTIVDTSITFTDISAVIIQNTYIPYEIYKSTGLNKYKLLIQQNNIFNTDDFTFKSTDKNKYSIIGRYGNFKLEKIYQNQTLEPSPELVFNLEEKISYIETKHAEKIKLNSDIYRNIFENIDFCIGDQVIERLDKTTMEIQYQFLKNLQKKKQIDKVTNMYEYEDKMRLVVPLEFWFNNQPNMYLPLVSLPYTDVSLKFKLNNLNKILASNYIILSEPTINIQVNIDGIILDTFEREMFGNNKHEYLIERFVQYPDNLIDNKSTTIKMIFKNPVKDIYYKTEILDSSDTCFYNTKIIIDDWQKEYKNKRALYNEFIKTCIYTTDISNNNSQDFDIIRTSIRENILKNSARFISFSKSYILIKYDIEMTIYLDEKYQKNFKSDSLLNLLRKKKSNLELYYTKIYKYKEIKTPISVIDSMVIKSNGSDLFREIDSTYFNKIIPYQKYLNSVDMGYYVYSFALNPLEEQPSGHLNFSLLEDIVLKSENNIQVSDKPVILKTIVKEYNLLRIMSGLSALAWTN